MWHVHPHRHCERRRARHHRRRVREGRRGRVRQGGVRRGRRELVPAVDARPDPRTSGRPVRRWGGSRTGRDHRRERQGRLPGERIGVRPQHRSRLRPLLGPAPGRRRLAARAGPGGDRPADGRLRALRRRQPCRRDRERRPRAALRRERRRRLRQLDLARRRYDRGVRPAHGAAALRRATRARPDRRRRPARGRDRRAARRDPHGAPAAHPGAHGRPAGAGGVQRLAGRAQHLPRLPARLRRHRALRRCVRHREHALYHHRPARPRAGDACARSGRLRARCASPSSSRGS